MPTIVPKKWTAKDIVSQKGKTAIVTGANSGIGYITALELARHGANVVLACRSEDRGKAALQTIEEELKLSPDAGKVEFRKLDVSSLASVKSFADEYKKTHDRLDLLINNAGIMVVPHKLTVDGIESQFATNYLGHFALTAQLIELVKRSASARIVNLSSIAHKQAKMDLGAIVTPTETYDASQVYQNSKLYTMLFTFELNRRFQQHGITNVIATTAHPGLAATNLSQGMIDGASWFTRPFIKLAFMLPIFQTPEFGALPSLYAATGTNVQANDFFGPDGFLSFSGYPTYEEPANVSKSTEHSKALWVESERLAGLNLPL